MSRRGRFSHPHQQLSFCFVFRGHPNGCEVMSHCGFDCISLLIHDVEHMPVGHLYNISSLEDISIQVALNF